MAISGLVHYVGGPLDGLAQLRFDGEWLPAVQHVYVPAHRLDPALLAQVRAGDVRWPRHTYYLERRAESVHYVLGQDDGAPDEAEPWE